MRAILTTTFVCFAISESFSLPASDDAIVATKHLVNIGGKALKYTARAGKLPILDDETGEVHGHIFFTAYTLDGGGESRPLTFAWNGGPGSSSSLVHLL